MQAWPPRWACIRRRSRLELRHDLVRVPAVRSHRGRGDLGRRRLSLGGPRAARERTDDEGAIKRILDDNAWLATHLFTPASLTVFTAGVLLTIGAWEWDQLWIVIGLAGYLATFVTGIA